MLAARDQENLVHAHHAAGASKPLNQGTRQLAPKTPGNKVPKTPLKISLNDENGGLGGGKAGLKTNGKGNENMVTGAKKGGLGDKNAFVTPMGPRARAPLGMKTTNAKAKALQTPAPPPVDNDLDKLKQRSASARKAKPRVSHAEMTKLELLGDKDDFEEREIEYMPPRAKGDTVNISKMEKVLIKIDLPDLPDDHYEVDLSVFDNGGLMRGAMNYFATRKGDDGFSNLEREEQRQQKIWDRSNRKIEAQLLRDVHSMNVLCTHHLECPRGLCKDTMEAREAAEKQYQKSIAVIDAETVSDMKKPAPLSRPSTMKSKSAAAALSQTRVSAAAPKVSTKPLAPSAKTRLSTSLVSRPKKSPAPTNPSSMRHTAAVAASKTTMGYAKGRSTSASLRTTILPKKDSEVPDASLPPAEYISRYGVPRLGSEMWLACKRAGCFDDEGQSLEEIFAGDHPHGLDALLREEAEQDFQLTF